VTDRSWQALLQPGDREDWFGFAAPPFDPTATAFSIDNALWLAELSALIYREGPDEAPGRPPRRSRGEILAAVGLREVSFVRRGTTQCALVRSNTASSPPFTILVFRGTSQLRDWATNLRAIPSRWPPGGRVHRGFRRAFVRVWHPLRTALAQLDGPLFCTGHSLGGALATLAASALRPRAAVTFGAPRTGDAAFAAALAGVPLHRVVHGADVVPSLPPEGELFGFRHAGELHRIGAPGHGEDAVPDAGDRRWYEPAAVLADHAPINYVAALQAAR
jgi:hypothetical protein